MGQSGRVPRVDELHTPRLHLRRWCDDDLEEFAALNADPEVCEFLPSTLDRAASDAMVERIEAHHDLHGFGLWCVDVPDEGCVGFVGLAIPAFEAPFLPAAEVGWRLARRAWGRAYATEGAVAVLDAAFGPIGLDEVISFTVPANLRSRAVMERLGLTHDPAEDFDHPRLPEGDPLRRHLLYRTDPARWATTRPTTEVGT